MIVLILFLTIFLLYFIDYYDRSFGVGDGKLITCDVNPTM